MSKLIVLDLSGEPLERIHKHVADHVKMGKCTMCGEDVDVSLFTDTISLKEYYISGLCMKCQDEIFNTDEEDKEE